MTRQRPDRWEHLPPDERRRREEQSAADRRRALTGSTEITTAELRRRREQSRADRRRAEIEEAIIRAVYGGDSGGTGRPRG